MSKQCPVVHFEMPYDQRDRMVTFYQKAFGWQTQMLGEEMGNYVLATTTEMDGCNPKKPGTINGGFSLLQRSAATSDGDRGRRRPNRASH